MKKRLWFVLCIISILSFSLSACKPAATEEPEKKASVVLITPNPLGDRSFIDAAARGREQFMKDYPDVQFDIIETNGVAEHEAAMRNAIAKGYDMIIGLAIDSELMFSLCEEFPDQKFGSASEIFAETLPANMAGYVINVHESSFLVGVIVGSLTKTKTVGAVLGGDSPGINQFFYGYKQGVLEVCPDCTVLSSYLGFDFSNPTLGLESALAQYDQGADIIYQVAGRSGEGVLQAAKDRGLYAIGVDSNQDDTQPGNVIVSSIKATNTTTYKLAEMAVKGFEQGFHSIGLSDGGAGLSWDDGSTTFEEKGPADMVALLPAVKEKVEEYRTAILAGDLKVCDALNEDPALCDPLK
ncbi:MAG: BMP family ABC transporter substrate-binding protein [Chloroflexi bacterium]|nr:BMP family ABC transporter substrate-binding protein [Chloroflexota bacterium]